MSFIGQAEVTIDKKSRLAVPAKFRSVLEAKHLGPGWISLPRGDKLLWLFPEAGFEKLSDGWDDSLIQDEDTEELQQALYSFSERLEMDATGRVTLPKEHLELTGLDGEVVVIGAKNHLEIHDRAAWTARDKERLAKMRSLMTKMAARQRQG